MSSPRCTCIEGCDHTVATSAVVNCPVHGTDLLDALMSTILARMSVISEQRAYDYERSRVHGGEKNPMPAPLDEKPLIDYYRDRYNKALGPRARRACVVDALEALKHAQRRVISTMDPVRDSFEWKCLIAEDPRPLKELQRIYSVGRSTVKRYKREYAGVAKTIWVEE